jgi:Tfp pilus assembly protein PilF
VALEPSSPVYLRHLLVVQFGRRKEAAALATAKRLVVLAPNDAKAHALLAVLLVGQSRGEDDLASVETHLKAAARDPSAAATRHYGLGLLALRRGQGAVAVRELNQAVQIDPEPEVTYYKLAQAHKMAGDSAAASRTLLEFRRRREQRQAEAEALGQLAQRSDDPSAYARAAAVFEAHGRQRQAAAIRAATPLRSTTPTTSAETPKIRGKDNPSAPRHSR